MGYVNSLEGNRSLPDVSILLAVSFHTSCFQDMALLGKACETTPICAALVPVWRCLPWKGREPKRSYKVDPISLINGVKKSPVNGMFKWVTFGSNPTYKIFITLYTYNL